MENRNPFLSENTKMFVLNTSLLKKLPEGSCGSSGSSGGDTLFISILKDEKNKKYTENIINDDIEEDTILRLK